MRSKRSSPVKSEAASRQEVRWLIRRDMEEVLAIDESSFEFPWTEEDFLCCLRQRHIIGMVLERDEIVMGFMIYELQKSVIRILNLAVGPFHRREGVGRKMVQRLLEKLSDQRRREVVVMVRESNVAAQLFFRACGFRMEHIIRDAYDENHKCGYEFVYRIGAEL